MAREGGPATSVNIYVHRLGSYFILRLITLQKITDKQCDKSTLRIIICFRRDRYMRNIYIL